MTAVDTVEQLAGHFAAFAESLDDGRTPRYAAIARYAAAHPEVLRVLLAAPATQRAPVLLLAAVHDLLLAGAGGELAGHYPGITARPAPGDPGPAFGRFVAEHEGELAAIVATRHTQTNEVGRCALLLPALGLLADALGPLALIDVGASAGLTLLVDRYAYRYRPGADLGAGRPVLECAVAGPVPLPTRLPAVAARRGLDLHPVDLRDPVQRRWLTACVYPERVDRVARLRDALAVAQPDPPPVVAGDAVTDVARAVAGLAPAGHPVVTTTWALSYLPARRQADFVAELDRAGRGTDLSWLALEAPALTPGLGLTGSADDHRSLLHLTTWRGGRRQCTLLADCHPHGDWLHWLG